MEEDTHILFSPVGMTAKLRANRSRVSLDQLKSAFQAEGQVSHPKT